MTHKDFVLIAGALAETLAAGAFSAEEMHRNITDALADALRSTNPRFDRARFLAACRGEPLTGRDKVRK